MATHVRGEHKQETLVKYGCAWCLDNDRRECKGDICKYADILDRYDKYNAYDKEMQKNMAAAFAVLKDAEE